MIVGFLRGALETTTLGFTQNQRQKWSKPRKVIKHAGSVVADCLLAESTSPGRPSAVCRRPHRCQDAGQAKMMMTPCHGKWKWLWLTVMKVKVKTVDSRSKANKTITDSVLSQFCHSSGRSGKMVMTICNESEHYIKTYTLSFYCPIVLTPLRCCP